MPVIDVVIVCSEKRSSRVHDVTVYARTQLGVQTGSDDCHAHRIVTQWCIVAQVMYPRMQDPEKKVMDNHVYQVIDNPRAKCKGLLKLGLWLQAID